MIMKLLQDIRQKFYNFNVTYIRLIQQADITVPFIITYFLV